MAFGKCIHVFKKIEGNHDMDRGRKTLGMKNIAIHSKFNVEV